MVVSSITSLKNLRVKAAVDIQRRSGDIGSRRACEKGNGRSHLLGFAVTAKRCRFFLQAGKVTVTRRVHVGINGTRLDIIYGDAYPNHEPSRGYRQRRRLLWPNSRKRLAKAWSRPRPSRSR